MNIIARAAVYIYDGSPIAPIFPAKAQKPSDDAGEYLSAIAEKLMTSDTSRTTYVAEGSAQEELLRRFILAPFGEAADALMRSIDETMQALEIAREGFDMAVFTFDRDNEPHLCVAQLPYRRGVVHQVENGEEGLSTMLLMHGTVLPLASSKAYAGFVVNLSTGDIRLRDTAVLTNVGNRQLFSEALFAMAPTRSTKEAVQVVTEAIAQAAPEMPEQELRPAVKRAMAASIEEKGVIDVQSVAEESVEPVIPVENKRVVAQLQKVKIRTDNSISISLPRSLADDENIFAVINNADGSISIVINHVQELRTE